MDDNKKKGKYLDYLQDKKSLLTILSLTLAFVLVIFLSLGASLYFRGFDDPTLFGDLAISIALCIYCLYFGIPEGKSIYEKKQGGRYQTARQSFITARGEVIKQDNSFNQWLDKFYQENKRDYFKEILSLHGDINNKVLDLDFSEIDLLKKPYLKDWSNTEFKGREPTYFRTLSEEQIEVVKAIFQGKISIEKLPNDFFKTFNGKVVNSEYIEQANLNKKGVKQIAMLVVMRIISILLFATIFTIFGVNVIQASGVEEALVRVYDMLRRLWTMATSFVYGFAVGKVMVMNECSSLEYKLRVNQQFLNDKAFIAIDEEELAKKEYEEYTKKGEEEQWEKPKEEVLLITNENS